MLWRSSRRPGWKLYALHQRRPYQAAGLSVVEVLVGLAMGAVLLAASAKSVVSQISSGNAIEIAQSLRNDMDRITCFLEAEIGEGSTISYGLPITGAGGCTGVSGNTAYLNRCGPPILPTGGLNLAGTRIAALVNDNLTIRAANAANPFSRAGLSTKTRVTLID